MSRFTARLRGAVAAPSPGKLVPTSQWNGTPDTGFGGVNPPKPTAVARTAAKPALRPLILQHHMITGADGSHFIVYTARAKGGVQKVRAWMEGNYIDKTDRSWVTYTDIRGVARVLYGYVFEVDYAAAQAIAANGRATVIAEAWANNGAYVKQLSPERTVHFRPGAALTAGARYDVVRTVGPSGADHTTLGAAMSYAAANSTVCVGIKIITSGNYIPAAATTKLLAATRPTEVFAADGVVAVMADYATSFLTCDLDGLRFRGTGIKIDTGASTNGQYVLGVRDGSNKVMQFDGVEIYTGGPAGRAGFTGSGSTLLRNGEQLNQFWIGGATGGRIEFKDCDMHDLTAYGVVFAESVINCDLADISGSALEKITGVIHGGSATRIGGYFSGLTTHLHAMDIAYVGAGVGSYSITDTSNGSTGKANGAPGFLNLFVDAVFATSFSLTTYPTTAALAAAITAYGNGWSATNDAANDRASSHLSRAGQVPAYVTYPAVSLVAGSTSLTTVMDIHADVVVHDGATYSNAIFEFLRIDELVASAPFSQNGDAIMQDVSYGPFAIRDTSSLNGNVAQYGYMSGKMEHVIYEGITIHGAGAGIYLKATSGIDADSQIKNSYFNTIFWSGAPDADLGFEGLVTKSALPSGATTGDGSKSLGAADESSFIDAATGVPVLDGSLKLLNGSYAGAKAPVATDDNGGWNLTV